MYDSIILILKITYNLIFTFIYRYTTVYNDTQSS